MTVKEIVSLLHADILHTGAYLDTEINAAFGSDMMSDTLAYADSHTLLLTGLCTLQVLRTVEMLDIPVIVFVRGKIPSEDMLELAAETDTCILQTKMTMFNACGILYQAGLTFDVDSDDFTRAGEASSRLKRTLKQMGLPPDIIRRISIVMYEGEINMVIHAHGGKITVTVDDDAVTMVLADIGPGIPDVEKAMQAGWSTASEAVRQQGFGAGMGLPNMKKNADTLEIDTVVGVGTTVTAVVRL